MYRWLDYHAGNKYSFPLEAAFLRGIFNAIAYPIIDKAHDIVMHATTAPTKIMLVGGLGSSPYLKESLQAAFPSMPIVSPSIGPSPAMEVVCLDVHGATQSAFTTSMLNPVAADDYGTSSVTDAGLSGFNLKPDIECDLVESQSNQPLNQLTHSKQPPEQGCVSPSTWEDQSVAEMLLDDIEAAHLLEALQASLNHRGTSASCKGSANAQDRGMTSKEAERLATVHTLGHMDSDAELAAALSMKFIAEVRPCFILQCWDCHHIIRESCGGLKFWSVVAWIIPVDLHTLPYLQIADWDMQTI